jgi:hypothetical protein
MATTFDRCGFVAQEVQRLDEDRCRLWKRMETRVELGLIGIAVRRGVYKEGEDGRRLPALWAGHL